MNQTPLIRNTRIVSLLVAIVWAVLIIACGGGIRNEEKSTGDKLPKEETLPTGSLQNEEKSKSEQRLIRDKLPKEENLPTGDKLIEYEILDKHNIPAGGYDLAILVSEQSSKTEVLKLAEHLSKIHKGKYQTISIFDAREAWKTLNAVEQSKDGFLPSPNQERELDKHWLVTINDDYKVFGHGNVRIDWVAKGRTEPHSHQDTNLTPEEVNNHAVKEKEKELREQREKKKRENEQKRVAAQLAAQKKQAENEAWLKENERKAQAVAEAKKRRAMQANEARATTLLTYAKKLVERGDDEKAKVRLKEVADEFPETEAGKEAIEIMKKKGW